MLQAIVLDQPIPTNDPSPAEERMAQAIARQTERIQKANARYAKASPARKRVIIAQDVLKWIAAGKLIPAGKDGLEGGGSVYFEGHSVHFPIYQNDWSTGARREYATPVVNGYDCTACAIGGIFACAIERGDAGGSLYQPEDDLGSGNPKLLGDGDRIRTVLAPLFSRDQLHLIEAAYEGERGSPTSLIEEMVPECKDLGMGCDSLLDELSLRRPAHFAQVQAAFALAAQHHKRADRMKAIMENIVANGGEFKP